jgi:hypothetical protein
MSLYVAVMSELLHPPAPSCPMVVLHRIVEEKPHQSAAFSLASKSQSTSLQILSPYILNLNSFLNYALVNPSY